MELIPNQFAGYFTREELHALDSAEHIPVIREHVDAIRLTRISGIVINSLLDSQISSDKPIELHSYGKLPESVIPQYSHTNNADIGSLDYQRINDVWSIEMTLQVDRKIVGDDQAPDLTEPDLVRYVDLSIIPLSGDSGESYSKLLEDVSHTSFPHLAFARKGFYDEHWQPLNTATPFGEQVEVMLLLGKIANIDLPHK